ncbi:hypothetical protein CAEBREN_08471 [Caenorhabditis brenneri]|uniref:Uncharacterized protein n=1 Tax=Caenorhabditis brenneri TaxID=135651 RepID=G0NCB2_CAEBE|nr:hypothetical protein CAEBREN_08471 [Caenorhabditis brenneri]
MPNGNNCLERLKISQNQINVDKRSSIGNNTRSEENNNIKTVKYITVYM